MMMRYLIFGKCILGFSLFIILLFLMHRRPNIMKFNTISRSSFTNVDPYLVLPDRGPDLKSLPDISMIKYPYKTRPNFTRFETGKYFNLRLSHGQYASCKILLNEFQKVMISLNLQDQWFLSSGSLIGSLRHHDMIPWDDDVDVCVDIQHRSKIQSALKNLSSKFAMASHLIRDKLFFKPIDEVAEVNSSTIGSFRIPGYAWSWPSIDINYFKRTGLNGAKEICNQRLCLYLTNIFPLTYRPFGGQWYPAPRNLITMLTTYYPTGDVCKSSHNSHAHERYIHSKTVKCETLLNKHPFVKRCPCRPAYSNRSDDLQCCDEYLVDGNGNVIHKIRTLLRPDEIQSSKFTANNNKFSCP